MRSALFVLRAFEVIFWACAWIVEVARVPRGNLVSLSRPISKIAFLDDFSGNTHGTNDAGAIVINGS